jgi:two-component system, NtrC family, sensor kinase
MTVASDDQARIRELERKIIAKDKTIAALIRRVEGKLVNAESAYAIVEQNLALEAIVNAKTREIEAQRHEMEKTVSDLKKAQAELTQAQRLTAIGQLAAGIAHEINTPIQYVSDNTEFLQRAFAALLDVVQAARSLFEGNTAVEGAAARTAAKKAKVDYLAKQVPRAIEQSLEGLRRVSSIVLAMKEFSHPSHGEKQLVNLADVIDSTVTVARNEWKYVADVTIEAEPGMPQVPLLRDEFNQVILNLVVNAAHAIGDVIVAGQTERGAIRISVAQRGKWAEVRVADTGTGIPPSARPKVFDPFFTTKGVGKGTGQGLAIAYSVVVDKHGGTIAFETEMGKGTTFIVRLPLETAAEKGGQAA